VFTCPTSCHASFGRSVPPTAWRVMFARASRRGPGDNDALT
jgi:hypothetical protein